MQSLFVWMKSHYCSKKLRFEQGYRLVHYVRASACKRLNSHDDSSFFRYYLSMLRRLSLITALFIPVTALALDISPGNLYKDVRADSREAPGINMLTREHIVQGYSDGRFGPSRLINRAEFLKIALLSGPPEIRPTDRRYNLFPVWEYTECAL
jgi:hypothetical protein